jgi:hypothetical protein
VGGAPAGARRFRAQGPDGRWIAPHVVTAAVTSPPPEAREADARGDAVTRPPRRGGPLTPRAPPALHARPRGRGRRSTARPAVVTASRGRLRASGRLLPHGLRQCRPAVGRPLAAAQATRTALSPEGCWHRAGACLALAPRGADATDPRQALGQAQPQGHRVPAIAGLGALPAPALQAAGPAAPPVTHGRQGAAWRGRGPRAPSPGGTARRRGLSPRGEGDLRPGWGQGARATRRGGGSRMPPAVKRGRARLARRGNNRAAGACAHTNARMVWARVAPPHAHNAPAAASPQASPAVQEHARRGEASQRAADRRGQPGFPTP